MKKTLPVFSEKDIEVIKQNYNKFGALYCKKFLPQTLPQIRNKAAKLKIKVSKEKISEYLKAKRPPKQGHVFKVGHEQFINIRTPEAAYILGLLWADGYVTPNRNQISLATTVPDSEHFIKIFEKTGNWIVYKGKPTKIGWKIPCIIYTSNFYLANFLKENGYISKSYLSADKILNKIPEHLQHFWLLGLLDGDGHIGNYDGSYKVSFASGITQNWNYLSNILNKLNIEYSIIRRESAHGNSSQLIIYGIKKVVKFLDYLYSDEKMTPLALKRKFDIYIKIKKQSQKVRYHGVCFDKGRNKWRSYAKSIRGYQKHLGFFETKELAEQSVKDFNPDLNTN